MNPFLIEAKDKIPVSDVAVLCNNLALHPDQIRDWIGDVTPLRCNFCGRYLANTPEYCCSECEEGARYRELYLRHYEAMMAVYRTRNQGHMVRKRLPRLIHICRTTRARYQPRVVRQQKGVI